MSLRVPFFICVHLRHLRILDRVGKRLLGASEFDETRNQEENGDGKAGEPLPDFDLSLPHKRKAKPFNNGNNWIKRHEPLKVIGHHGARIKDAAGVHPELNYRRDAHLEIPESGAERRYNEPDAQAEKSSLKDEERDNYDSVARVYRGALREKEEIEAEEDRELDQKLPDIADAVCDRDGQSRKIHLCEQRRVCGEGIGCPAKAGGEVIPNDNSGHVEKEWRDIVCGNSRDFSENDLEHDCAYERLHEIPKRAENCLLVQRDEIAPDHQRYQIAIAPNVPQRQVQQRLPGCNHRNPGGTRRDCFVSKVVGAGHGRERIPPPS